MAHAESYDPNQDVDIQALYRYQAGIVEPQELAAKNIPQLPDRRPPRKMAGSIALGLITVGALGGFQRGGRSALYRLHRKSRRQHKPHYRFTGGIPVQNRRCPGGTRSGARLAEGRIYHHEWRGGQFFCSSRRLGSGIQLYGTREPGHSLIHTKHKNGRYTGLGSISDRQPAAATCNHNVPVRSARIGSVFLILWYNFGTSLSIYIRASGSRSSEAP
jgi:hypothetical protein